MRYQSLVAFAISAASVEAGSGVCRPQLFH